MFHGRIHGSDDTSNSGKCCGHGHGRGHGQSAQGGQAGENGEGKGHGRGGHRMPLAGKMLGTTTVGERGQVVIPAEAREELDVQSGDKFVVFGNKRKGSLILVKSDVFDKIADFFMSKSKKLEQFSEELFAMSNDGETDEYDDEVADSYSDSDANLDTAADTESTTEAVEQEAPKESSPEA